MSTNNSVAGLEYPTQKAMLMGQLAHETGGFKFMNEIGGGSKYEDRADLGNIQTGDGDN
jgi:predicted chitinase